MLVAELDGCIIAFSRFLRSELEALYVHPAHGRHRVGELLLRNVERLVSSSNVKTLYLDAALNAVQFYRSAGYDILEPSMPVFDNGIALPCIRMHKSLPIWQRQKPAVRI